MNFIPSLAWAVDNLLAPMVVGLMLIAVEQLIDKKKNGGASAKKCAYFSAF